MSQSPQHSETTDDTTVEDTVDKTALVPNRRSMEMRIDILAAIGALGLAACLATVFMLADGGARVLGVAGASLLAVAGALMYRSYTHAVAANRHIEAAHTNADRTARQDALTGLPNRLAFRQHLEEAIQTHSGNGVVVLFADLDRFKEVNDGLGHDAGDALLIEIGKRFAASLGPDDMLARLGGDEFAAVLTGADALSRVDRVAQKVIQDVHEPIVVKGDVVSIGVSIGTASSDRENVSSEELLRRADIAMYRAKADASMSHRHFSHDMDEALMMKRSMRSDLDEALLSQQLRLELQPIFCARTGKIASAEALMRWTHPGQGELSPGMFIQHAEESGQIIELGDWAIDRALSNIKELGGIPVAVNASPVQFRHQGFSKSVADRLLKSNVSPHLLRIEITEGVLITHTDAAKRTIRQLRDIGVKVVLDDFGTGYSSLSYLQSFDFDAVKIDRSFVRDLGGKHQSTQLTRAIIDMGHGLGMEVVAEGIENARQASLLQLLGCDFLQGYHLGVPMSLEALIRKAARAEAAHKAAVSEGGADTATAVTAFS